MAQRVYFVFAPLSLIEMVEEYVHAPERRQGVLLQLAEQAHGHVRAVTVSERVVSGVTTTNREADQNESFLVARNVQPYLISAQDEGEVLDAVRWLESPRPEAALEEFFVEQARRLGFSVNALDRNEYRVPPVPELARKLAEYLDPIVHLWNWCAVRVSPSRWRRMWFAVRHLVGSPDVHTKDPALALAAYGSATWKSLGLLFGRLRPTWWQGRNRWLGYLAQRERFKCAQLTVQEFGPGGVEERVVSEPLPAPTAGSGMNELAGMLRSTATLAPRLRFDGWEGGLPISGEGYTTCAFLPPAVAGALRQQMCSPVWTDWGPRIASLFENSDAQVEQWRTVVCSSMRYAEERNLLVFEGDEIFTWAMRWPMF